jgi:group I intron endonuclease
MNIYIITNKVNSKWYTGQTIQTLKKRWGRHVSDAISCRSDLPIHRAIRKYGPTNFEIRFIANADNLDELNSMDVRTIRLLNTLVPNGYNLDGGGKNKVVHPDTKKKQELK